MVVFCTWKVFGKATKKEVAKNTANLAARAVDVDSPEHEGPENAGSEGASKRNKSVAKKPNVKICSYRKVEVWNW